MAGKKSGLGRGLDALFPEKTVQSKPKTVKTVKEEKKVAVDTKKSSQQETSNGERMMKISMIEPNREQPRKKFDEDALQELSESIKQYGILQPLLVSDKKDYYEIVAGDLNPGEEAMAYKRLIDEFHLKQDEIAERVSKSRTAVTNSMRLLKLDSRVQQMMVDEMISAGHARAILAISDPEQQYNAAMKVFDEKLSVRETEKQVKSILTPTKKKPVVSNPTEDAIYESLEEKMKGITGTRVFIHRKKNNKGKIEIEYYSRDDLDRIIDLFESIG